MTSLRFRATRRALEAATLTALLLVPASSSARLLELPATRPQAEQRVPSELYEVVKIVDGDTLHIQRKGAKEKLRLLSVDTEEKLNPSFKSTPGKPQTVFGEETRLWTEAYMEQFRDEAGKLSVGLAFPGGAEQRDVYGRLLCHVVMPDGTDFNLLLVELGKSPYFNKYGHSRIRHADFVAAQARAQRNKLGIWDPTTNQPIGSDVPAALRDYAKLIPWWQARAEAIDGFRQRAAKGEAGLIDAEDPQALLQATERGARVEVFGTLDRFFEERSGDLTVLFRAGAKDAALRVVIPAAARADFEDFELEALTRELRQNYVYVEGELTRGPRGPQLTTTSPKSWRRAGAEPGS